MAPRELPEPVAPGDPWSATRRYTLYGAAFGACFPLGSLRFLVVTGRAPESIGLLELMAWAHMARPLLYFIDTAPLFLGLLARVAGQRQDRLEALNASLELEVAAKTERLRGAPQESRAAREEIAFRAEHDSLTGLCNRRRFQEELRRWLGHRSRYGRSMGLVFVDLDGIKAINDVHGHEAGDVVLVALARAIQVGLRGTDALARWGGDEFVILLPETGAEAAAVIARRVMDRVRNIAVPFRGTVLTIGASIGIAAAPEHADTPKGLIACADAAMYHAKRCGGGCTMHSDRLAPRRHLKRQRPAADRTVLTSRIP